VESRIVMSALQGTSKADNVPVDAVFAGIWDSVGALIGRGLVASPLREVSIAVLIVAGVGAFAVVAGALTKTSGTRASHLFNVQRLGVALIVTVVASAVGWVTYGYVWDGYGIPLPFRYLTPLVPLAAVVALPFFERIGRWSWVYAVGVTLSTIFFSGDFDQFVFNTSFILQGIV